MKTISVPHGRPGIKKQNPSLMCSFPWQSFEHIYPEKAYSSRAHATHYFEMSFGEGPFQKHLLEKKKGINAMLANLVWHPLPWYTPKVLLRDKSWASETTPLTNRSEKIAGGAATSSIMEIEATQWLKFTPALTSTQNVHQTHWIVHHGRTCSISLTMVIWGLFLLGTAYFAGWTARRGFANYCHNLHVPHLYGPAGPIGKETARVGLVEIGFKVEV